MVQKKRRITAAKYHILGFITIVGIMSVLWHQSFVSLAESTGTVTADSAKIREKADTNSEVIGSAARGKSFSIRDEVQDDSGMIWYQVYVDANTLGYIRSDLVSKQDGDETPQSAAGGADAQQAPGASVQPDNVMDAQYAVVSPEAIKVRTEPSTNASVVDRLTRDTQVIVSGQSDGSDGKVWYYVNFTGSSGSERTGFIRSDLLTLGDMVPIPEEEPQEPGEPVSEPYSAPVNHDYELTYEQGEDGSYVWYLYDYTEGQNGYRQPLQQLLDATQTQNEESAGDTKTLVRQRVAIVVLIILVVVLIAAAVVMALKLRDVYYEDYEDEEEEQEEETSTQRRRRPEETEAAATQRRRRSEEAEAAPAQRRRRSEEAEETSARRRRYTEDAESETRPESSSNAAPKRKTKNFLLDDDEFEFEFLNMDDKDL